MIEGHVTDDGFPIVVLEVCGQQWRAIIDTGFNGDIELPESLQADLHGECVGRVSSLLAAGQRIEEVSSRQTSLDSFRCARIVDKQ